MLYPVQPAIFTGMRNIILAIRKTIPMPYPVQPDDLLAYDPAYILR
jgi:hypothetical protein